MSITYNNQHAHLGKKIMKKHEMLKLSLKDSNQTYSEVVENGNIMYVLSTSVIPLIENRTISAHTTFILEFCKLFKSKGHQIVLIGYGNMFPTRETQINGNNPYCDLFIDLHVPYKMEEIDNHNWYTCTPNFEKQRDIMRENFYNNLNICLEIMKINQLFIIEPIHPIVKRRISTIFIMNFGSFSDSPYNVYCSEIWKKQVYIEYKWMLNLSSSKDTVVIHPWLDLHEFTVKEKNPEKQCDKLTFLYMARCSEIKGLTYFLSLAKIFEKNPKYQFIVAGNGIEEYFISKNIHYYTFPNVKLVGLLNHIERISMLQNVTALIQPSQYEEPFGMNVIESMACGTPVFVTMKGTLPFLVNHKINGFYLPDTITFESINQIESYFQLANNIDPIVCRKYVERYFNSERAYKKYCKFFRRNEISF